MRNFINNLDYERKKKIRLITIISLIVVLNILLIIAFASNQTDNTVETFASDNTHQTTVPDGYTAITNATELAGIADNLSGNYILMNDIDLSSISTFDVIGQSSSSAFKGILDGNNYKISNMNIESANQYVGMFGYVSGGTIKNLVLENQTVKSTYTASTAYIGGIAGYISSGTIENVGIIGTSSVENTTATNTVHIGGIAGYISNITITNTSTFSNIIANTTGSAQANAGGLSGYMVAGTINSSVISFE